MSNYRVNSKQQLTEIMGEPVDFVKEKIATQLDDEMKEFISNSSLLFISTIDGNGNPDISPKGDPAGFVLVDGDSLLHIPDRPGNKLMFGFNNLIENPAIGILFVTPNCRETLRIKGRASISNDPALLKQMSVNGKPALLVSSITIEECFFHCGKAMIRSKVWNPDSWAKKGDSLLVKQFAKKLNADKELEKLIEAEIETNYEQELY